MPPGRHFLDLFNFDFTFSIYGQVVRFFMHCVLGAVCHFHHLHLQFISIHCLFSGLQNIRQWTQISLKKRLQKSLSHDWIHEKSSHKFPLRKYYVQLEWEKKERTAMGSETVTLTSIHDLIKQLQQAGARASQLSNSSSVIIEGKIN